MINTNPNIFTLIKIDFINLFLIMRKLQMLGQYVYNLIFYLFLDTLTLCLCDGANLQINHYN